MVRPTILGPRERLVAGRAFDALSYNARQRFVISIEAARAADTRERRIAKAVSELRQSA